MSSDPALQTLIVESRELLQAMEDSLLQIENISGLDGMENTDLRKLLQEFLGRIDCVHKKLY